MEFGEVYYNGGNGYGDYKDYPHFYQRAEWLYNYYINHNLTGKVYVIGCGYGYVIKHLIEDFGVPSNRVKGIEFSSYAYQKATELGLDQYLTFINIEDFDFSTIPDLDIVVSWNVLDCLPNETVAEQVVNKLNQVAGIQLHIICVVDDDPNAQNYIDNYYFIKNRSYWANLFNKEKTILVEYESKKVWRRTLTEWIREYGWNIPLCWGKVSE